MTKKSLVPIQLPADPTTALQAATKQYVDSMIIIATSDPIAANPAAELWYNPNATGVTYP